MTDMRPHTLSYRTPPPELRSRAGWVVGRWLIGLGLMLMIFSAIRIPMETGHRALLREDDLGDWFTAELPRRSWEASRRAGLPVGPQPPWPAPTVPTWLTVRSLQSLHALNVVGAIALLVIVYRCKKTPEHTDKLLHRYAIVQVSLSTIALAIMLLGYHRIFHPSPDGFELIMLGIEAALIAGSVVLLTYHRDENDFAPVPVATLA